MREHLNERSQPHNRGFVDLGDAVAHCWLLDEDVTPSHQRFPKAGHVATIHRQDGNGELLDFVPSHLGGVSRLQAFQITHGYNRVVLYLEPDSNRFQVRKDRSSMTPKLGDVLPWSQWQATFARNMPQFLQDMINNEKIKEIKSDSETGTRSRLERILGVFSPPKRSRKRPSEEHATAYKPNDDGKHRLGTLDLPGNVPKKGDGPPPGPVVNPDEVHTRGGSDGEDNQRASTTDPDGLRGRKVRGAKKARRIEKSERYPEFTLISERHGEWDISQGKRDPEDMRNKAARFVPSPIPQNADRIYINLDWSGFDDAVRFCLRELGLEHDDKSYEMAFRTTISESKVALASGVMSLDGMSRQGGWTEDDKRMAVSENSLSICCCGVRERTIQAIDKMLRGRAGGKRAVA
jgi:hypothetical protein